MKYGVFFPNFGSYSDARALAALAHDAEQAGWDGFFIWDHIASDYWPERMVDPWVALTAAALNTATVRLGALVTPLPRRRPWKVARETVSLDRLSGGRLVFGAGIGGGEGEWRCLGEETDLRVRGAMLDEALDVLTGLWRGQPFSYDGQYYHIEDRHFLPVPAQSPRIPVWVGGFWPNKGPFRRAARWDGMFPLFHVEGDEELVQLRDVIAYTLDQRTESGPFDIVYAGRPTPGSDPDQAAAIVAPVAEAGVTWWLENIVPVRFGADWKDDVWPVEAMRERVLQGPPRL